MAQISNRGRRWPVMLTLTLVVGLLGGAILGRVTAPAPAQPAPGAASTDLPAATRPPRATQTPLGVEALPEVDVDALIDIRSPADVEAKRRDLLSFIYGQPSLSTDLPDVTENASLTLPGIDLTKLAAYKVDLLKVTIPEGFTSYSFLVHAPSPGRRLVVYHLGHQAAPDPQDFENIEAYLKAGYDVVIMNLPLYGPNIDAVVVDTKCCGPIVVTDHEMMAWLEHPIRPFILPVNEVVNYAEKQGYQHIYLTGISGGGWTTMLYGALDPRPTGIAPVAGSQPLWFSAAGRVNSIDFEQRLPDLYRLAGYEDLYVMGAYGPGRWSLFGFNLYDKCCFRGTTYEAYETVVQKRIAALGAGEFSVYLDANQHKHEYGQSILEAVMARMAKDQ